MKKIISLVLAMVVIACSLTGCGSANKITIAAGTPGGHYYSYNNTFTETLRGKNPDLEVELKETAGSKSNVSLVNEGLADIGIAQANVVDEFIKGTSGNEFVNNDDGSHKSTVKFHILGSPFEEHLQLIVRKDANWSGENYPEKLTVSIGEKDSGTNYFIKIIRGDKYLNNKGVEIKELSLDDSIEEFKSGKIDAFYYVGSTKNEMIEKLGKEVPIKLQELDDSFADFASGVSNYGKLSKIEAGAYSWQETAVTTISTSAVLFASDSLDKDIEQQVLQAISDSNNLEQLKSIHFDINTTNETDTPTIKLDMFLTLALAVLIVFLGNFLRKKLKFLTKFCIPAPVVGGIIFAILTCILYACGILEFQFDETLKDVCMTMFFTTIGFQANVKELKRGGFTLLIFIISIAVLIALQNGTAITLGNLFGVGSGVGMCSGSIPMVGGHGTSGAFGPILEGHGITGATTICTAAATFGLVMGSFMGGPLANHLIDKKNLVSTAVPVEETGASEGGLANKISSYAPAMYRIAISMGVGIIISKLLSLTGLTFPSYIGAMIVAAIIRNVSEIKKIETPMHQINDIGDISLTLFLGIAMITLKLWELASLALPLIGLLVAQTILMFIFARFVLFNILGKDYDAAVICAGACGFGMGATPNAMANMQAVTNKYVPSTKAFIIVPIVGGMFVDFINSILITIFINVI